MRLYENNKQRGGVMKQSYCYHDHKASFFPIIPAFLPSWTLSFLPCFVPSVLPSFLPFVFASFLPSFLTYLLP